MTTSGKQLLAVFPADYFSVNKPDEMFVDQVNALRETGNDCEFVNLDELATAALSQSGAPSALYRGWMLTAEDYQQLLSVVEGTGSTPVTNLESYLASHHLPNWYPAISHLTPETVILEKDCDLQQELINLDWQRYFVKDYVKSLKTGDGAIITSAQQINSLAKQMEQFRGTIEGGFCIRKVEDFIPSTETRYFVIGGTPFGPDPATAVPDVVQDCASCWHQPFYSVDIIETRTGETRVVEIGDGQVSDLVGWTAARFAEVLTASNLETPQ